MDIPFESFANLVYRLGHPPKSKSSQQPLSPEKIFQSWLSHLPRPFPPGTGKHLFRLLFPHEGSRRRYGLKEIKLALELERILCISGLTKWDAVGWGDAGSGCLGKELERSMRSRVPAGTKLNISLRQIDRILDDLAAHSSFSQLSQMPVNFPSQDSLLTRLYRDSGLSPYSLCLITQIILRDLRPLLNPLPSFRVRNPTAMLRLKSTAGPAQLDLHVAMRCWHPQMSSLYRSGIGNIDVCADTVECMSAGFSSSSRGPTVGINVQIHKCLKGRSIQDGLNEFMKRGKQAPAEVWAETKYDGYRMQIHVQLRDNCTPEIKIFSKSKRDATADRAFTHAIILSALGLPVLASLPLHPAMSRRLGEPPRRRIQRSIILEAEVVPYNERNREWNRGPGIEEFWWLGAAGVTAAATSPRFRIDNDRHLCLVFFDVLHLDGQNLLKVPLSQRRKLLEDSVRTIDGFSHLAEYTVIPLESGRTEAHERLKVAFDAACEKREEGLVLKASDSLYLDSRWRWVKLKKDYIPELGDCIDLVLLGAGWNQDRARELRVDTSVFTTFYLGVLTNAATVKAKVETPHFQLLFQASYGLSRDVLESVNGTIRHGRWASKPYDRDDRLKRRLLGLSWTFDIPQGMRPPSVLFENPLCVEVMGAGFQRIIGSKYYELRWPRLQKIFEPSERSWTEALTSSALKDIAHKALGYTILPKSPTSPHSSSRDDSIRALWRSNSAIALTDIPSLPTPSPERPSPRRMRSAPNILGMATSSLPSPPPSARKRTMGSAAKRLFMDDFEDQDHRGESPSEGINHAQDKRRKVDLESPLFDNYIPTNEIKRSFFDEQSSASPLTIIDLNLSSINRNPKIGDSNPCNPTAPEAIVSDTKLKDTNKRRPRRTPSLRSRIGKLIKPGK